MGGRLSGGSSRKLAVLFLAVVAPPTVTLVWLGLQLLEQDRSLWAQRELERRQAAAQAVIRSLEQSLGEAAREVAVELGVPVKTVCNAKHRILARLRSLRCEIEETGPTHDAMS